MIKIAICDDCKTHQEHVEKLLKTSKSLPLEFQISMFSSGKELIYSPMLREFDLIFLDIVMEELDGIATLPSLSNLNCYIIFMSTTNDRLRELFQQNVLGFLDKPIEKQDFEQKILNFSQLYQRNLGQVFIFKKAGIPFKVLEQDIVFFENFGHYIHLNTTTEVHIFKAKISDLWEEFEENPSFVMPSRSYIANLKYSSLSAKNHLQTKHLNTQKEITIGRTRKDDTIARLLAFASKKGGL